MNDLASAVGEAALEGLLDRKGIGDELDMIRSEDPMTWDEIVHEVGLAAIAALGGAGKMS